jgi:hypothetical protein
VTGVQTYALPIYRIETTKLSGINEEAEMRKVIVSSERIRSIRRNIVEKVPLLVHKKARNGTVRPIEVVVVCVGKKQTYLEWRSKLNLAKRFEVDEDAVVNCRPEGGAERGEGETVVRFTNRTRFLDLTFSKRLEGEAFILVVQSYVPNITVIV